MTMKDNGGPAFPCQQAETQDGCWNQTFDSGMSLRDWFAGQAPECPGWWMGDGCPTPPPGWKEGDGASAWEEACRRWNIQRLALWRFAYADAMMEARK